jgi:DNA-binding protein H-NS
LTHYDDLLKQRAAIEEQIAARKAEKIKDMRVEMAEWGITPQDLGGGAAKPSRAKKSPPKYEDGAGNTWTGVGRRPVWVQTALDQGRTLDQFLIRQS